MESILSSLEESSRFRDVLQDSSRHDGGAIDAEESSFAAFSNALRQFVLDDASPPHGAALAAASQTKLSSSDTASWLYETCSKIPTPLPPLQLSLAVLSAVQQSGKDESRIQSSLFELFGEGEQSIEALFDVMGKLDEIEKVTEGELRKFAEGASGDTNAAAQSSERTQHEEHLNILRAEAYESANLVTALRSELHTTSNNGTGNYSSRGTHSVTRKSDREVEKSYKRAIKQALTAVNEAREGGALTEGDDLFLRSQLSTNGGGSGGGGGGSAMEQMLLRNEEAMLYNNNLHAPRGLDGMSSSQIQSMKRNLLPEGTREYDDGINRGLPMGTEREIKDGLYEKVTIPAPTRSDEEKRILQQSRINLDEVLGNDTDERLAFEGTSSLNPMQSKVFDMAYNTRENLLICAPTGAGKVRFISVNN